MTLAKLDDMGQEIFDSRYAYPGEKTWAERSKVIARIVDFHELVLSHSEECLFL